MLLITQCASTKTLQFDMRSNMSDGIVYLSYKENLLRINEMQWEVALDIDWVDAQKTANKICKNWDYDYAVQGNNADKECLKYGPDTRCLEWLVIFDYICKDF